MKKERLFLIDGFGENNNQHIVKAKTKTEALNKIWEDYYITENKFLIKYGYSPFVKSNLEVVDLEKELKDKKYYIL